ncbi:hypothetical protein STEG23_001937, partial [Scotinomys teguina]
MYVRFVPCTWTPKQWRIQEEILGRTGGPWRILDQVHNTCAKLGQQQGKKEGMRVGLSSILVPSVLSPCEQHLCLNSEPYPVPEGQGAYFRSKVKRTRVL